MGDFECIETGFNCADETINFGTRHIGYDSLYEISTLACLKSEENSQNTKEVKINSQVKNGRLILSTNHSIKLFGDTELTNILFNLNFDSIIIIAYLSDNGDYLVVCLENGLVNIFEIETSSLIFSQAVLTDVDDSFVVKCFQEEINLLGISFIFVLSNGKIYRVYVHVRNNAEEENHENGTSADFELIDDLDSNVKVAAFSHPFLITDGSEICVLNVIEKTLIRNFSFKLKTMYPFGFKFLGLDENGYLVRICPLTLVIFPVDYDYLLDDMFVITDTQKNQVLAYTCRNEQGESFLQLFNSDLSRIFSVKISYPVSLICLDNTTDDILFLTKVIKDNCICELRIQSVYETDPELRLKRLITREKFEEAEQFAKLFNINPIIIMKAKAELIVGKAECTSKDINDLIKLLDCINDDCFNLFCCSNVDCGCLEDVRRVLEYGITVVPKNHSDCKELKKVLTEMLFKFDTFMALSGEKDIHSWSRFLPADLIDEVKYYLKNYELENAIIVYNRLDKKTIQESLTDNRIEDILLILNNLPNSVYQPFLSTFIPITMSHTPSMLSVFVKWLHNKILQLEKRDASSFPENGIKLADSILKLLRVDKNDSIAFQKHRTTSQRGISELGSLIDGLKTLEKLKKEFRIHIQLSEYLQGPESLIKTLLSTLMADPEECDFFFKEFLCPYMLQNHFDIDTILFDEIKVLINYDDCHSIIEVLIKFIGSIEIKLKAVRGILENAQVPWNSIVRSIGQEALKHSHPLVSVIRNILEDEKRMIVLRHPKYKIKLKQITTIDELKYVVERLIYVDEPTLLSDVYNLCKTPKDKQEANIILTKRFILKGKFEEALTVLDNNSKEDICECILWHVSYAEILINDSYVSSDIRDKYYKALNILSKKLLDNCDDEFKKRSFEQHIAILKGTYHINNLFRHQITTYDLMQESKKKQIFNEILEEVSDSIKSGSSDANKILDTCDKLANCFSFDKDFILVELSGRIGKFEVILRAAEYLLENESSSKHLCLMAVLFLKYLASRELQLPGDSFSDSCLDLPVETTDELKDDEDISESDMYLQGLKLSQKMIQQALVKADEHNVLAVNMVMNWINCCFYMTRTENSLQNYIYKNIYNSPYCAPSYSTFLAVRDIFQHYVGYIDKIDDSNWQYITYFPKDVPKLTENELLQYLSSLPSTVENFCREGQHLTAFKLLKTLEQHLSLVLCSKSDVLKTIQSVLKLKCLPLLLQVVVAAKRIDVTLLYNLLLELREDYIKYIQYYMKAFKRQPRKLYDLSTVGLKLLDIHQENQGRETMFNAAVTCKWWNRLKNAQKEIPYDTFFKFNPITRLSTLISLDCMDVELIRDYCEDFNNLKPEEYYKEYLKSCFVNWKPDYECKTHLDGKIELIVKNNENVLFEKAQKIIQCIEDKSDVVVMLNKILNTANFYQYEVFICIFKILDSYSEAVDTRTANIQILTFLKNYQRFSEPSQREKEEWYTSFPDSHALDPLSKFRLPFIQLLFTSDIWMIIRPEVNLKTYKYWFNATTSLKHLKKDDICVYSVKQVVNAMNGILDNTMNSGWILHPKLEDLFLEIDECVQHISNLERATSVVYHVMNYIPNGADKVNAARLSYKYACKYREKFPKSSDVEKAFIKVKNKYYGFSAMHILHKFNLTDEKYIQLVAQPETLIENLYKDQRIIKQAGFVSFSCPDINRAVDELANLFELQIQKIRYDLLNSWLSSSDVDVDFDSTIVFPTIPLKMPSRSDTNDDNLKRAIYICSTGGKSFWETYLLKVGLNEENSTEAEQKSTSFKAQALKCFCAITDEETVAKLTKLTYTEFLNYVDKLTLLSELESLGISLVIETLDQYNKKELLKRLSQVGNSLAIKVMGSICITYSMDENRYWEYIINNSIRLGMINELKIYVNFLKEKYDRNYYVKAWQVIIENSFQQVSFSSEEELEEIYINIFLTIQSSPVLFYLNFEKAITQCIHSGKLEFAAVLLQYLPDVKKDLYICDILKKKNLLTDLDNLNKKGIWGVRNVKAWLEKRSPVKKNNN